jgi:electron transfer flavoprotein alpha subunit
MSVLIFIDQADGLVKKSANEALSYGSKVAEQLGVQAHGIVLGKTTSNLEELGKYGVQTIHTVSNDQLNTVDAQVYAKIIADAALAVNAQVVIFTQSQNGKAIAGRVAVRLKAGLVAGACALPNTNNGFTVKKTVFSGKAFANISITSAIKVISINTNSYGVFANTGTAVVKEFDTTVATPKVVVTKVDKIVGELPLTEADIVVSGGRGLKGPENWGILLDLAKELNAATACSRPVGDAHWRPHHEHVGQTGVQVAPNLYIAIGISGAIQHLAGVNRSKVIVVINKDPEAPFFKAADYGIIGDAFEVLPKLTSAVKQLKANG